ncbi:hypothetical protein THOM_2916 [Trachipleistophora hominis]|uniref:Uncharacterized protein n=1 Tax=Trachipleistophora hominis TaxID=72359 RepID=L7JRV0_TRAHO|nr:hypothetical protein THOM_2916 [Trachipleistophora hominis]
MQKSDTKQRKRVPGISEHLKAIREINDRINAITASVKECKDKIAQLIKEEKSNSPKVQLIAQKQQLNDDLSAVMEERDKLMEEKKALLPEYLKLKEDLAAEKRKINLKENVLELDNKIKEINDNIMKCTLTTQQEKEYANRLMDLKKKKTFCATLKGKELRIKTMGDELHVIKDKLAHNANAAHKIKLSINDVRNELNRLRETKIKNPRIEENDAKISNLKKEKDELLEKRRKVQLQIQEKEKEHERLMQEMEKQQEIENQKKEIVKEMREKEGRKNLLLKEIVEIDPHKFDILANELKNVQSNALPLSLVKSLAELKLPIPKDSEDINALLNTIKDRKKEYESSIVGKVEDINKKIKDIDVELVKCKEELSKMPAVEVGIRRMRGN